MPLLTYRGSYTPKRVASFTSQVYQKITRQTGSVSKVEIDRITQLASTNSHGKYFFEARKLISFEFSMVHLNVSIFLLRKFFIDVVSKFDSLMFPIN